MEVSPGTIAVAVITGIVFVACMIMSIQYFCCRPKDEETIIFTAYQQYIVD
jgi:hypothetical protein